MKKKLTISIFLIAALSVLLSGVVGIWTFHQREMDTARENLTELLALMDAQNYETWTEELLEQFTKAAPEKRLTIISPDGTVLGDTDKESRENHATRPEVVEAKENGVGEDVRRSATTGIYTIYVARVFTDGYIGRAAMSLSTVDTLVAQTAVGLVAAAVLSLALALLLARRLAASTAKPVEEAEVAVRQVDETLQSARSEFTANVTHELKTPLTSIKGFTDMLSSGMVTKPEDQQRFLTMISVEVDRLSNLVDDILTVSELETVAGATGTERAPLKSIAQEVQTILQPQADKAGVKLNVTGGEGKDRSSLDLPGVQQQLLEALCATGKPVVLVLYGPGVFALPWAAEHTAAMVQAFMPGAEAGRVVADVLDGTVNPGGHLPFTVPHHIGQLPIVYNHRMGSGYNPRNFAFGQWLRVFFMPNKQQEFNVSFRPFNR